MAPAAETTLDLGGLRTVAVGDRDAARVVVVLLHGFSMTPADLTPFAHSLQAPAWFLFPEGPLEASPVGRSWWYTDLALRAQSLAAGPRDFADQHPPDLPAARAQLLTMVEAAKARAGTRPLVLGGFSSGGMVACDMLLRSSLSIAALALFSSSRIAFDEWQPLLAQRRVAGLPVLLSHGEHDADIAFAAGEALRDCLRAAGAEVEWVPFEQGHEIPLVVWRRLRKRLLALA